MNPLHLPPTSLLIPKRPGYRALWIASATWVIGSIAGATVAMANAPVGQWSPDLSPSVALPSRHSAGELQRAVDADALTPRFKPGCQTCGFVETIRRLDATGSTPAVYEFTIRLRNGSTRVSNDASAGKWRVGDPIMLIGGDKPSSSGTPVSL